jgi:predicted Zn-dependent protease
MLETRLHELLQAIRAYARAQGIDAEFSFHREHSSLVRLGNSSVALSTYEDLTRFGVQVMQGRRVGSYSLTADITSEAQLRDALHRAREYCTASLEKDYAPIFGVVEAEIDDSHGYDPALEDISPEAKTALCAQVIGALKPRGAYDFSGSWSSGSTEIYYSSTANDREDYRKLTDGKLLVVLKEQQRKWELAVEQTGKSVTDFSAEAMIADFEQFLPLYERYDGYQSPLGPARVVFGPQAIAELVMIAVWSGLSGRGWEEKRAFTAGNHAGERIFSPGVTLIDDPTHPDVFGLPFDLNGKTRKPFMLVEDGILRGLIYDSTTAAKYGKPPTGHDVSSCDLCFATGAAPAGLAAGLALAGDALYIPHLHYVNMPDPSRGIFTGSSRFNAMRIEGGACTAPLLSSRVTDAIANVLSHVVAISSRSVPVNVSNTYGRRAPDATSVPEYLICDNVRISDVAESF